MNQLREAGELFGLKNMKKPKIKQIKNSGN